MNTMSEIVGRPKQSRERERAGRFLFVVLCHGFVAARSLTVAALKEIRTST